MVDILIGAIAYQLNEHHKQPDASPAKCELSQYVIGKSPILNVTRDTPRSGRFTLWHRQLKT